MVFAFNVNQASMFPPFMGWRFPLRGPLDNSLRVLQGGSVGLQKPCKGHYTSKDIKGGVLERNVAVATTVVQEALPLVSCQAPIGLKFESALKHRKSEEVLS